VANFALGMRISAKEVMNPVTGEPIQVENNWVLCLIPNILQAKVEFYFLGGGLVLTQDFVLARQVLYHLSYFTSSQNGILVCLGS
jgi:hypothetical protein